jgi:hypothetical protein
MLTVTVLTGAGGLLAPIATATIAPDAAASPSDTPITASALPFTVEPVLEGL